MVDAAEDYAVSYHMYHKYMILTHVANRPAAVLTVCPAMVRALEVQLIATALRNCCSMVPAYLHKPTPQYMTNPGSKLLPGHVCKAGTGQWSSACSDSKHLMLAYYFCLAGLFLHIVYEFVAADSCGYAGRVCSCCLFKQRVTTTHVVEGPQFTILTPNNEVPAHRRRQCDE
jgi:hypothetical protein